jgi:TRAP-type C4-dicarboxylate transport system permease small subunit
VLEIVLLVCIVAALVVLAALLFDYVRPIARYAEYVLLAGSVVIILVVMAFVCAEIVMRYAFNAPIPGHLEGSELLMPMIVFLAISYTQRTHGHVGMDLVLDALAPAIRRGADILMLLVSIFVCAVLAWFSYKNARQLWEYDDVTMTPPYFKTWPAAASIALGYAMTGVRMTIQLLSRLDPQRFPDDTPVDDDGLHQASD